MTLVLVLLLAVPALALALLLLLPATVLAYQALGYLFGKERLAPAQHPGQTAAPPPRVAVLMPAHNEAAGIGAVIAALRPELGAGDRLLVVADNCTDDTALVAQQAGAEVTVRDDAERRGKGYALDWGVRALAADPPDVVVVIDADCVVEPGSLQRLAVACALSARPTQATYLMELPACPSLKHRIAAFAWMFKTHFRALGFHRAGLPCPLMGTGMAFPWQVFRHAPLASGNTVEDLQLGIDLALVGLAPQYCPQAVVRSWFAASDAATNTQRTRWEQGHLMTLARQLPRLVRAMVVQRRWQLGAIAWDLSVPPLSFLLLAQFAVLLANLLAWWLTGLALGLVLALVGSGLVATVVAVAWFALGRRVISARQLLGVPAYVLGKLPMYFQLLAGRQQREWVRTERDNGGKP